MKLLKSSVALADSSESVVCLVMSYGVKPKESSVSLFTAKWKPLPLPEVLEGGEVTTLSPLNTDIVRRHVNLIEYREEGEEKETKSTDFRLTILKWNGRTYNKN